MSVASQGAVQALVSVLVVASAALTGCQDLGDGAVEAAHPALALTHEALEVVAQRGDVVLLRSAASEGAPGTDERPTFRMRVESPDGSVDSPGRVLTGALTDRGALWVTPSFDLVDDAGVTIDRGVVPELAVHGDGHTIAYPRRDGSRAAVYVADLASAAAAPRLVTQGLALADRPLFLPGGRLVVVGAVASGIAGVWIVDPSGRAPAVAVTNASLRTGGPLGPAFVPPPAYHASMRVEGEALVYDDGTGVRRVALAADVHNGASP